MGYGLRGGESALQDNRIVEPDQTWWRPSEAKLALSTSELLNTPRKKKFGTSPPCFLIVFRNSADSSRHREPLQPKSVNNCRAIIISNVRPGQVSRQQHGKSLLRWVNARIVFDTIAF
jgi:hypothetical protein